MMWRPVVGDGLERCQVASSPDGHRMSGTTLRAGDNGPVEIRYSVNLSQDWTALTVGVHIRAPDEDRSVALVRREDGSWLVGDDTIDAFAGASDIDFAWTPATNTIPIRRLDLEPGQSATIQAVVIPFPGRDVERRTQTYERLAPRRWRYGSGDYETDLTTNEHGFVVAYPGQWMAV
jgi:hypothetical protein